MPRMPWQIEKMLAGLAPARRSTGLKRVWKTYSLMNPFLEIEDFPWRLDASLKDGMVHLTVEGGSIAGGINGRLIIRNTWSRYLTLLQNLSPGPFCRDL